MQKHDANDFIAMYWDTDNIIWIIAMILMLSDTIYPTPDGSCLVSLACSVGSHERTNYANGPSRMTCEQRDQCVKE